MLWLSLSRRSEAGPNLFVSVVVDLNHRQKKEKICEKNTLDVNVIVNALDHATSCIYWILEK